MSLKIKLQKVYTVFNSSGSVTNLDVSSNVEDNRLNDSLVDTKCKVLLGHRVREKWAIEKLGYVYSQSRPDSANEIANLTDEEVYLNQAKNKLGYKFSDDCDLKLGNSLEIICYKRKRFSLRFEYHGIFQNLAQFKTY
jgi:hypothetical protein